MRLYGEAYQDGLIKAVFIRIYYYYYEPKDSLKLKSIETPHINDLFRLIINVMESKNEGYDLQDVDVKSLQSVMSRIPKKRKRVKKRSPNSNLYLDFDLGIIGCTS